MEDVREIRWRSWNTSSGASTTGRDCEGDRGGDHVGEVGERMGKDGKMDCHVRENAVGHSNGHAEVIEKSWDV